MIIYQAYQYNEEVYTISEAFKDDCDQNLKVVPGIVTLHVFHYTYHSENADSAQSISIYELDLYIIVRVKSTMRLLLEPLWLSQALIR